MLFALVEELRPFLSACRRTPAFALKSRKTGWHLTCPRGEFEIRLTGPGYENVLELLADLSPSEVIQAGFAGSLTESIARYEIRVIARVRRADQVLEVPISPRVRQEFRRLPAASIVTVPRPVDASIKELMHQHGAADLVDMETHAAADCCAEEGVPYTGIRVVSDGLDDVIPEAVISAFDGRQFKVGPLVRRAIFDRQLRRELLGLRRVAKQAAERLATILIEGLSAEEV